MRAKGGKGLPGWCLLYWETGKLLPRLLVPLIRCFLHSSQKDPSKTQVGVATSILKTLQWLPQDQSWGSTIVCKVICDVGATLLHILLLQLCRSDAATLACCISVRWSLTIYCTSQGHHLLPVHWHSPLFVVLCVPQVSAWLSSSFHLGLCSNISFSESPLIILFKTAAPRSHHPVTLF